MTLTEGLLIKLANSVPGDFKKTLVDQTNTKMYSHFLVVKGTKYREICSVPVPIDYWYEVTCEEIDKEPLNNFREISKYEQAKRFLL
jgi:hypothetical protein